MNKEVILLGYTSPAHTNWFPWNRFKQAFDELGKENRWTELSNFKRESGKSYIFVCWNMPDVLDLISLGLLTKEDIVLQKVTSMTKRESSANWGNDPNQFYSTWNWPAYQMCLDVINQGYNLYAFGCKTDISLHPVKQDIVNKLDKRFIPIPWSTCMYSDQELQKQTVLSDNFEYDACFVGSIWGVKGRGNLESVRDYLMPVLNSTNEVYIGGSGTPRGRVSNSDHVAAIKKSKLCPIVNAPSWRAERGVQDRFWTVFASGRFGISDTEGVYDFFDESEVVCEVDPGEYIEKSLYFMKNIDKQIPYIEKIQNRIKQEYNWTRNFEKIFEVIR